MMENSISVVINTLNEEKNLERALRSVKWANEIVVCDMYSEDKTVEIAKKYGAKICFHPKTGYVEPARNFAINKASFSWVLLLDADEEIPIALGKRLQSIANENLADVVKIARKNIIFNKWMKASMWWPDYNIRFFKKGAISWSDIIHSQPEVSGRELVLPDEENLAIVHHNYTSFSQFITRMDRYSQIQAQELKDSDTKFVWTDLVEKPLSEFLTRFFAGRGFEDGLHGLALSFLQAFSFLLVYLKLWELEGFSQNQISLQDFKAARVKAGKELDFWFKNSQATHNPLKKIIAKLKKE